LFATNQAVATIDGDISALNDRAVKYDGAVGDAKDVITLAGAGGTTISNLAAGGVSAGSTDAINGSQLHGLSQSLAVSLGGGAVVKPDGTVTGPTYIIQGGNYSTVYDGFAAVDGSLTTIKSTLASISSGGGLKYFHANSAAADSQATGAQSVAIGPQSVASGGGALAAGDGASASATGAVALGQGASANNANDVALGAGSVSQQAVGAASVTIKGATYQFAGTAPVGTVSVGDTGAERTLTNLAAGRIDANSTDAVNGSQLYATNQAIEGLQTGVGGLVQNAVKYDTAPGGGKANSITLEGADPNAPVLISNVAAGVAPTDAVNVAQLNRAASTTLATANTYTDTRVGAAAAESRQYTDQVAASTLTQANAYTDSQFGILNHDIGQVRAEARQAAAIGLAAGSLRYDSRPGKLSVAAGDGEWRGQGAASFGAGYTSENGRVRLNAGATTSGGRWGAGVGLSLTLN
jgi:autotransporter adhesin